MLIATAIALATVAASNAADNVKSY